MIIYEDILREFYKQRIKYVIVGGIALNLLGAKRVTYDLDILVQMKENNLRKIVEILREKGYSVKQPVDPMGLADDKTRNGWIKNKHLKALNFYKDNTGEEVDIILDNGVDFEKAYKNSRVIRGKNMSIRVISPDDLIKMKKHAGRKVDDMDIELLKEIKRIERKI